VANQVNEAAEIENSADVLALNGALAKEDQVVHANSATALRAARVSLKESPPARVNLESRKDSAVARSDLARRRTSKGKFFQTRLFTYELEKVTTSSEG
jgi:hypothetical protein